MRLVWLGGMLAGMLMNAVLAVPVPLDGLLVSADADPAVLAAQAAHRAAMEDATARKIDAGPQVFMNASAGQYRELNSANLVDDYYSRHMAVGLRFPLLGTLHSRLQALESARFEAQRAQFQIALRRAEHGLALKTAYVDWWRAQAESKVCHRLRERAELSLGQIQERRHAGRLRASEALSEQGGWESLLARCETADRLAPELQSQLAMLAGRTLPAGAESVVMPLPVEPAAMDDWRAHIDLHPSVQGQQATVNEHQQLKERSWYSSVDASLSLGYAMENRSGVPSQGNNFVAALNVSIPFQIGTHARATGNAAAARYQSARHQLDANRRQLLADVGKLVRAQHQAYQTLSVQDKKAASARVRMDEQQARENLDAADGVVLRQAAERDYYQAKLDRIAAWHELWSQHAALQMFTEDNPQAAHLLGRKTVSWSEDKLTLRTVPSASDPGVQQGKAQGLSWATGTYVWDSHALLDDERRPGELAALRAAGVRRVYIGLDAWQVKAMTRTRQGLARLIEQARAQDLAVSLLLGDPLWLTPQHRGELTGLVRELADLSFDALHLDLEVEQLGWPVPDGRLTQWLDTLKAVRTASPWPIEISSHYRWFEPAAQGGLCVPCELPRLGVSAVSLMIYTRNPDRSTALARAAAQRWPALTFRLAQSMEPKLSPEESWAGADSRRMAESMRKWREVLEPLGVQGVDWQRWADYRLHEATTQ